MRRRHVHAIFGTAGVLLAALVVAFAMRLAQAERVDRAIARAAAPAAADRDVPEARFAQAFAQGAAGRYEPALRAYKALVQAGHEPLREEIGRAHV